MSMERPYRSIRPSRPEFWAAGVIAILLGVMALVPVELGAGPRVASATPDEGTGNLIVNKECLAPNPVTGKLAPSVKGGGDFRFEVLIEEPPFVIALFTLDCGQSHKVEGLQPGTYTVSETSSATNADATSGGFVPKENSCIGVEVKADKTGMRSSATCYSYSARLLQPQARWDRWRALSERAAFCQSWPSPFRVIRRLREPGWRGSRPCRHGSRPGRGRSCPRRRGSPRR
jgi:hypothetical protein